jgi:conjugative transposon TraN protein
MKRNRKIYVFALIWLTTLVPCLAQNTFMEMEMLTVNEEVTTLITAGENIRFVDISTDKVIGDQPINNVVRIKPKEPATDGDILGLITIVTERYRTQYGLVYTSLIKEAVADKEIQLQEMIPYTNPAVSMSTDEMYTFARRIWNSPARYRDVSSRGNRLRIRLNNIYTAGDYFFIDFSITNKTNIRFDIDEIRLKLTDKKITKATNTQTLELKPELMLENASSFQSGYRNVLVVKKLTFPNQKILSIEVSEKQISGRAISLNIDYEDVLCADSFHDNLLRVE